MVAHSIDRGAAAARRHSDLHRQFGHHLGALSVFVRHERVVIQFGIWNLEFGISVSHVRAAQHPRRLGVLSRCGGGAGV